MGMPKAPDLGSFTTSLALAGPPLGAYLY